MAYRAFLSHSSSDAALAKRLEALAGIAGVELYLAEHDLRPGKQLSKKVQAAIRQSDLVVVLLTRNSYSSAYVQQEIGYAISSEKHVLPVVERSVPPTALAMLEGTEYIPLDFNAPETATIVLAEQLKLLKNQKLRTDIIVGIIVLTALAILLAQEGR